MTTIYVKDTTIQINECKSVKEFFETVDIEDFDTEYQSLSIYYDNDEIYDYDGTKIPSKRGIRYAVYRECRIFYVYHPEYATIEIGPTGKVDIF